MPELDDLFVALQESHPGIPLEKIVEQFKIRIEHYAKAGRALYAHKRE
jgi:hypothetical protein